MKKVDKKVNKKIVLYVVIAIVIAAIIGLMYFMKVKKYKEAYKPYADKIETFGFNERYNDKESNAYKKVRKGEAVGLVLSAVYNTNNIRDIGYNALFEDNNSEWVRYAEVEGLIKEGSITKENVNKKVTMLELITYLGKSKELFLKQTINTDVALNLRGIKKLTEEEIKYVKDAVQMGIIENKGYFNAGKKIRRGEFNKIIMDYMLENWINYHKKCDQNYLKFFSLLLIYPKAMDFVSKFHH